MIDLHFVHESSQSPLFLLADRVLNGRLEGQLRRWRRAGVPARAMAELLSDELELLVSAQTIRRWLRDLPEEPVAKEAS